MRLRSVIFILLQLSLSFVCRRASDLERWGRIWVVRKDLLVNKVIDDQKEAVPFPENDAWLRLMSM